MPYATRFARRPFASGLAAAAAALALGCAHGPAAAPVPGGAGTAAECHRAESERFVFHSDPWINLHHFLFEWARNVPERPEGDFRRATEVTEAGELATLAGGERQAWSRALDFYRERLVSRRLVFDRELIALREQLAAIACGEAGLEEVDDELAAVLAEAMPVYRRHWWSAHHADNMAWIEAMQEMAASYETGLAERLAAAYGGEWPAERLRVDVAAYTNWAGAYSTNHPDKVTISSRAYRGLEALEMLFHEVSHSSFFEQPIFGQLTAAFRAHGAELPERLPHVIQFAVPPELLRAALPAEERAAYRSVAASVAARSRWRDQWEVVLEHWRPFLAGEIDRAEAFDRVAAALADGD